MAQSSHAPLPSFASLAVVIAHVCMKEPWHYALAIALSYTAYL